MSLDDLAWEDLSVMLAALERGSLNQAAQALGVSQSTASRRLVRLEGALGSRLFDRTPEGLLPTNLALSLAPHAQLIAGHMADIRRLASGQEAAPEGRVRLAVVDGLVPYWMAPRLREFQLRYPAVQLDLLAAQAVVDLVRREADMAVRFVRPTAPDLVVRSLGWVPFAAYAHPSLLGVNPMPWAALLDPNATFQETQWIERYAKPKNLTRVAAWPDLFATVCAGAGAGVLSPLVAEPAGLVRVHQGCPPVPSRELLLVYHRAMRDVPRVAVLRQWLIETVEELLGPQGATAS